MKKRTLLVLPLVLAAVTQQTAALTITKQTGWLETACVAWLPVEGAAGYNVYYTGEGITSQQLDAPLVRKYSGYYRADAPGLKAGTYTLTVAAVDSSGVETESASTSQLTVLAHDRSGFGFAPQSPSFGTSSGAYNDDGTLRANSKVIYLTEKSASAVTLDVVTDSKGKVTACTGIGAILTARQKGYDKTPLAIRLIGRISAAAMLASEGALGSDNDLQIKGKGYTELNTTIEGIGDDATAYGWGILVRACMNIEVRNIGFMNFPEDGVSLNTDNRNIWVHNCDFFYGKQGSGDKNKGDGSLDSKESGYVTLSYNHFWDAGKCNLLGNGTENPEYLTYHHNWYDHSDSRHPRVRFHSVHVYNNYYDGNSKYGIGATQNSSIFSENNYFRKCKYPMLISLQGTDVYNGSGGTFSSENGGIIKACGNYIEGATRFVPYSQNNTEFDAYDAADKSQTVPDNVRTKAGNFTYNNFDTNPAVMYACTPDAVSDVPDKVKAYAGRMEGGDFKWTFTDADDASDAIITALADAIKNYAGSLVSVQGEDEDDDDNGNGEGGGNDVPAGNAVGGSLCSLVNEGASSGFSISGNTSDSKGNVTVNGITYSCCLKMESATSIAFTLSSPKTLTLVFLASETGKKVKIDDAAYTTDGQGCVATLLDAGSHTITKGDAINLFYIALTGDGSGISTQNGNAPVYFSNGVVRNPANEYLQVYDAAGKLILSGRGDLNIAGFARGAYTIRSVSGKTVKAVL